MYLFNSKHHNYQSGRFIRILILEECWMQVINSLKTDACSSLNSSVLIVFLVCSAILTINWTSCNKTFLHSFFCAIWRHSYACYTVPSTLIFFFFLIMDLNALYKVYGHYWLTTYSTKVMMETLPFSPVNSFQCLKLI